MEKLRVYCDWSKNSEMHLRAIDVMRAWHECIKDQVKAEYLGVPAGGQWAPIEANQ